LRNASSGIGTTVTDNTDGRTGEYIGRFAPSPTGPLHFGSLVAAVASYLQARSCRGRWLLRIEDIDPPRERKGAADAIVRALDAYGFEWDGPVLYQSGNSAHHHEAVERLLREGLAYRCGCSRQRLATALQGPLGRIYPGTCRAGSTSRSSAIRLRTDNEPVAFVDLVQGPQVQRLESQSGDFVIRRRDNLIAYHLAVVVDDFAQGVSEVVRGVDLLESTPRQIHLQQMLNYSTPRYAHIPVVVNRAGQKLSKTTGAGGIPLDKTAKVLCAALRALKQPVPPDLAAAGQPAVWAWATRSWRLGAMAAQRSVPEPPGAYG
jgi:glutamyl-Q tRNA(Asp) synthetase